MNSAMRKAAILLVLTGMLLSACGTNLWGTIYLDVTPSPTSTWTVLADPEPTSTNVPLTPSATPTATVLPSPTLTPTSAVTPGTLDPRIFYTSQSGDSLDVVAIHFGVQASDISSSTNLPTTGLINPGTLLYLPDRLSQTTSPAQQIIPDCELVNSPCAQSFDIEGYVNSAGGELYNYHEARGNGIITGAEEVQQLAYNSSISPRMLLALIQYYTGWVQGTPYPGVDEIYPLGYYDLSFPGLYQQQRLVIRELLAGYYGWRDGTLTSLIFPDGSTLRLAPDLNAGTVALQYMFSRHLNQAEWFPAIDPANTNSFVALFTSMFGDPWERARETETESLFPPDLTQPAFSLPFEVGVPWTLTGGPHPAWDQESAWAALDFAPPMDAAGCGVSTAWVVAVASGWIVRSGDGYVVIDLDPDGFEQTGWVVLYLHIATKDRIPKGRWVNAGDHIGHPSCEGGELVTGTHVHIARKYNGEWVSAGDPLPFVMSGWTAHTGSAPYQGTLTRGDKVVTASVVSEGKSQIIRQPGE